MEATTCASGPSDPSDVVVEEEEERVAACDAEAEGTAAGDGGAISGAAAGAGISSNDGEEGTSAKEIHVRTFTINV